MQSGFKNHYIQILLHTPIIKRSDSKADVLNKNATDSENATL